MSHYSELLDVANAKLQAENARLKEEIKALKDLAYYKPGISYQALFTGALHMGDEHFALKEAVKGMRKTLKLIRDVTKSIPGAREIARDTLEKYKDLVG